MLTKHNVEQGTEEWFKLRSGLVTASNAAKFIEGGYKQNNLHLRVIIILKEAKTLNQKQ